MFKFHVEGELCCKIEGNGKFIAKKGAMIAFIGNFKFDKMLLGPDNGGGVMNSLLGMAKRNDSYQYVKLKPTSSSYNRWQSNHA